MPEGVDEQVQIMPVKKLIIVCPTCKKDLDLQKPESLEISLETIKCTTPLVFLYNHIKNSARVKSVQNISEIVFSF